MAVTAQMNERGGGGGGARKRGEKKGNKNSAQLRNI